MATPKNQPLHPGPYVRELALTPKGLSVTEAAKLVGVGRPAFSNFLNGNSYVTTDMAARVERAFGIPARQLLDQQAAYDAFTAQEKGAPPNARRYVPPFLAIKANEIEAWAVDSIAARTRLAVFLRILVNSTGIELAGSNFPGNDDGERPGWDGFTLAGKGTPWIPAGKVGWEFGVDVKVKQKADGDFGKSTGNVSEAERLGTTFIFVTPRRWYGKDNWIAQQRAKGRWKDVRAYDRSDLEQWLEQSIPGQAWFANETGRAASKVRTLDRAWDDWADVATPTLSPGLFDTAIDAAGRIVSHYLTNAPSRPLAIVADSTDEALAFLSALISTENEQLGTCRDRVVIFDEPGVFAKFASDPTDIIAVTTSREVELEMALQAHSMHTIVVYPRNATTRDPDVVLEPLNSTAFERALNGMGKRRDEIQRLESETGRSLTVLRRRLSEVEVVRKPEWAEDATLAASLVPFVLVGAWDTDTILDREALSLIADSEPFEKLEKQCHRLSKVNDAPVWMVGKYRGLVSKIDSLFAVKHWISADDLRRYFDVARLILGEDDPALDLPEKDRWLASIHGKSREFSAALRRGVSETLVLLAVHGNGLFLNRLGIDCEIEAALIIRDLLTTDGKALDARKLEANERDLPTYAEAAPDEFLSIIERDLRAGESAALGLMRPAEAGPFGSGGARTGLLWALEGLAWSPQTFPRAVQILARLAEIEIDDNWANKPINSLLSIFRAWMPQTAATTEQRIAVVTGLAQKHPRIAWRICVAQFDSYSRTGHYSHKPSWRPDGFGFGEPERSWEPINRFVGAMIEMSLSWPSPSRETLSDLVERVVELEGRDQKRVWQAIANWANAGATDVDKAWLREKIRVSVMSSRATRQNKDEKFKGLRTAATKAYTALEPSDLLAKHEWLFRTSWVEESAGEVGEEAVDFRKRDERIAVLRTKALQEINKERGIDGVLELAAMGESAWEIGWLVATQLLDTEETVLLLKKLVGDETADMSPAEKQVVRAALQSIGTREGRIGVIQRTTEGASAVCRARLLRLAPFDQATWELVDQLQPPSRDDYWLAVVPGYRAAKCELQEGVERLMKAERPRAAFSHAKHELELLRDETVFELLSAMAREGGRDRPGEYQLSPHEVEDAFEIVEKSADFTVDQKAQLEFAYLDILSDPGGSTGGGIPNLERYVQDHPEFFVQAVSWTYRRDDEGEDDEPWRVEPKRIQFFAERGRKLLDGLARLPGYNQDGQLDAGLLTKWIRAAKEIGEQVSRLEMTELSIGKLLSAAPAGEDGTWPCEAVRDVLELFQSESMCSGLTTGKFNRRGVTWRGEGGQPERDLAKQYEGWANALRYTHPFTVAYVLDRMKQTYARDANWQDSEARIRRRLR